MKNKYKVEDRVTERPEIKSLGLALTNKIKQQLTLIAELRELPPKAVKANLRIRRINLFIHQSITVIWW